MKLTLSIGGGFTGLSQEYSVEVTSLDPDTRSDLMNYIASVTAYKPSNLNETWSLDNKEVPIDLQKMNEPLLKLYYHMKQNLSYK
jgi:hypothetical protein